MFETSQQIVTHTYGKNTQLEEATRNIVIKKRKITIGNEKSSHLS